MNATKCDRCKKYYDTELPQIVYRRSGFSMDVQSYDICPACVKIFQAFMKIGEEKEQTE